MLKLYGQARSRASRSLWMLEEIGLPYEHVLNRRVASMAD
jgi:glutathione S-transferase